MVPVTGVALLMQRLMTAATLSEIPWVYFIPVLAPIGLYSWLALRWAIEQFNREDVLFREAERLDCAVAQGAVPRQGAVADDGAGVLLPRRPDRPALAVAGPGRTAGLEVHTMLTQLAFVAMPPLFMTLMLNTQPLASIYLRWPTGRRRASRRCWRCFCSRRWRG